MPIGKRTSCKASANDEVTKTLNILKSVRQLNPDTYIFKATGSHMHHRGQNEVSHEDFVISHAKIGHS